MSIAQYPAKSWDTVMQVNLNSAFYLTQALLPLIEVSQNGRILYTTSSVGRKGRAYWGAYAVSKFATEGFMQVLADELENTSDIRVNSLNPGATRTNMRARAYPAENPGHNATPEDLMPIYLYLMGRDSRELSGQQIDAQPK
jgi:NAD(P)-dependent dehydrogenase (short-subunit alcohol dehydrogenase family)